MGRRWTKEDIRYLLGVYHTPEDMGMLFEDRVFIKKALARERAPYVKNVAEEEIYGRLAGGQTLVVRGPKGDGLSVATFAALARKILFDRAVVVDVLLRKGFSDDATDLRNIADSIKELGREPILYLDVSKPWQYPLKPWMKLTQYMPHRLNRLTATLEDVETAFGNGEVTTVVVLSDDLYEILKSKLGKHAVVEVNSGDADFLKRLVQAYSGCSNDVAAEVAEAVAKHDCGRAVLATLTADLLARFNCERRAVAEALKTAEYRAKKFIADYIWYVLFNEDWEYAEIHAPLILLRYFEEPMSIERAEDFLVSLGLPEGRIRGSPAARWIAMRHCRLIDETIREVVETGSLEDGLYYVMHQARVDYYEYFRAKGYFK